MRGLLEGLGRAAAVLVLSSVASHASAQSKSRPAATAPTSLSGTWRAGATSMDVAVESWGGDCGPRPQSSSSGGGGVVTVTQNDKQLTIRSRDSEVRSDACWSQNPSMRRSSSSVVDQVWITRCKTPPNDPREEEGTYTLKVLGPDTLLYRDVSRYNWALKTSKCVATFTTSQTLMRGSADKAAAVKTATPVVAPVAAAATPATPPPVPEAPERLCTPGAAARIALRPRRADIQVGQRVCLRARVTDASDCVLPNAPVEWSLTHSKAVRGELNNGCFTAASSTAEAEGEFTVVATSSGLRAEGVVNVRSVDLSGLIAQRIEGGGLNGFAEPEVPVAAPKAAAKISTRTVTTPHSSMGMWLGIGLVIVLAGAAAALVLRRKQPAAPPSDDDYGPPPTKPAVEPARRSSAPSAERNSTHSKPAVATTPEVAAAGDAWICPLCRFGYPAHQKTCPRDGTALMPYGEFNKRSKETVQAKQKRCPKCGELSPASAVFCGNDGTTLVET